MQAEGRLRGMEKRAMTIVFRACVVMTVFVVSAVAINAQTLNNGGFEIGGGPYSVLARRRGMAKARTR